MACGRRCSTVLAGGQLLGAQLGGPLLHAWVRSVASSAPASRIEPGGVMLVGTPRNNAMPPSWNIPVSKDTRVRVDFF